MLLKDSLWLKTQSQMIGFQLEWTSWLQDSSKQTREASNVNLTSKFDFVYIIKMAVADDARSYMAAQSIQELNERYALR